MNWGTPKDSPKMSYHPRPLSWIVVLVGALAIFLIYASFVLVSSPIGATFHGYFYGIGSSEKLDVSGSPINDASIDNKPSLDSQSSTGTSDSNIEKTDTASNSQIDNSTSSSMNPPPSEDVSETPSVKPPPKPTTSFGDGVDKANTSLPAQANSQIDSTSSVTVPAEAGAGSSNLTGGIRTEETPSTVLNDQSDGVSTAPKETSTTSENSTSTAVPESAEKSDNASNVGSVNSGYYCNLFTYTSLF